MTAFFAAKLVGKIVLPAINDKLTGNSFAKR
jgi:hypothetical protein